MSLGGRRFWLVAGVVWLAGTPGAARADECQSAYQEFERIGKTEVAKDVRKLSEAFMSEDWHDRCALARQNVDMQVKLLDVQKKVERLCGSRYRPKCDSACAERGLEKSRSEAATACTPPAPKPPRQAMVDDADKCMPSDDVAAAVAVCTQVINSGKYKGERLAGLYLTLSMIRELAPNANEDAVIDDLNHAIAITPQADNLYFARGHAYAGKKDYAHAVADYNKAISLSTDPAIYRSERADANLKWGKVDEAFAEMADLIRLNGDGLNAAVMLPNLLDQRGRMYEAAGQRDKAIADYRRILTLGPKFNEVGMAAQFDDAAAEAHRNLKRLGAK